MSQSNPRERGKPESDRVKRPGILRCMCCRSDFRSWDRVLNRLCEKCSKASDDNMFTISSWS